MAAEVMVHRPGGWFPPEVMRIIVDHLYWDDETVENIERLSRWAQFETLGLLYEAPISHHIFEKTYLVYGGESQPTIATAKKLRALSSNSSRFGHARHVRHLTVYTTKFSVDESEAPLSMQYLKECIMSSGVVTDFTAGRKVSALKSLCLGPGIMTIPLIELPQVLRHHYQLESLSIDMMHSTFFSSRNFLLPELTSCLSSIRQLQFTTVACVDQRQWVLDTAAQLPHLEALSLVFDVVDEEDSGNEDDGNFAKRKEWQLFQKIPALRSFQMVMYKFRDLDEIDTFVDQASRVPLHSLSLMHLLCRDAEQTLADLRLLHRLQRSPLRRTVVRLHLGVELEALQSLLLDPDNPWASVEELFLDFPRYDAPQNGPDLDFLTCFPNLKVLSIGISPIANRSHGIINNPTTFDEGGPCFKHNVWQTIPLYCPELKGLSLSIPFTNKEWGFFLQVLPEMKKLDHLHIRNVPKPAPVYTIEDIDNLLTPSERKKQTVRDVLDRNPDLVVGMGIRNLCIMTSRRGELEEQTERIIMSRNLRAFVLNTACIWYPPYFHPYYFGVKP